MILERDCKIYVYERQTLFMFSERVNLCHVYCWFIQFQSRFLRDGVVVVFWGGGLVFLKSFLISEFGAFQSTPEATAIFWMKWLGRN